LDFCCWRGRPAKENLQPLFIFFKPKRDLNQARLVDVQATKSVTVVDPSDQHKYGLGNVRPTIGESNALFKRRRAIFRVTALDL
jgi:hypothetical protein